MKKHLVRERHHMTSDVESVWCDANWMKAEETDDPSESTCEACLRECAELGAMAAKRLANVSYAKAHGFDISDLERKP